MRNIDGLQPQEAFDELLKYLYFKQNFEIHEALLEESLPSILEVKKFFNKFLNIKENFSSDIWRDKKFHLSDSCLDEINKLIFPIQFNKISYDIRSHAIKEFISSDLRKGHGIFLTPDEVVKTIIKVINPSYKDKVLDPACGSGTFLIEFLNYINPTKKCEVFGFEKNPRMLLLSELNLNHYKTVKFHKNLTDSLQNSSSNNKFDIVVTNPPFGVSIDSKNYNFQSFKTCCDKNGTPLKKQSSEIVFIEKCFQMLKPGGTLAIVIPKSIATNSSQGLSRRVLGEYGYIYSIINLPPETFATTGTQTTTIVLFAKKFKNKSEGNEENKIAYANINNVGFDSTGRSRDSNELINLHLLIKNVLETGINNENVICIKNVNKKESFSILEDIFIKKTKQKDGFRLEEICTFIGTGKTPSRDKYAKDGSFLLKVGNLTGSGINWFPRDRNFIAKEELSKRLTSKLPLILKKGDILMTSSAHSPIYIAKKSDVYIGTPDFLQEKELSFVGEIMLIRPDLKKISPFLLLAFLRSSETIKDIQTMVRGQTAHLHSNDLKNLIVPFEIFEKDSCYSLVSKILEKQAHISAENNKLKAKEKELLP